MSAPRPYRALETLAPQAWTAQLALGTFGQAAVVATNGTDIAGLHAYNLVSTIELARGDVNVGAAYGYGGWRYGTHVALNRLDLTVEPGEVFCLLGANGAGKTTTINLFLNFVEPSEGQALVNGLDVTAKPLETKRYLAYMPQNYSETPKAIEAVAPAKIPHRRVRKRTVRRKRNPAVAALASRSRPASVVAARTETSGRVSLTFTTPPAARPKRTEKFPGTTSMRSMRSVATVVARPYR